MTSFISPFCNIDFTKINEHGHIAKSGINVMIAIFVNIDRFSPEENWPFSGKPMLSYSL
jgi:hypothetical protein